MMTEQQLLAKIETLGNFLVTIFHVLALFVIGASIVWSAVMGYIEIIHLHGYPQLKDILLLFIYLELGAMVGIYFKTRRLPVRFLVYVAITALTRFLTIDLKSMNGDDILAVAGATMMLALATLALHFGDYYSSKCGDGDR
jgi:phosphate starvation-inducible membrane PsiE